MSQDPDENADHPRRTKTKRVMVSKEENSLSDLLGAALPKGVLAGLRGITSPDVPALAAKPAIEAFSYGTATPVMGELAEAALAYTHDEPHALSNQAPAGLTLVADNGAAGEDAESVAVKAEATQLLTEILRMDPEVKAGLGPEIALLKAAQQSGRASGIDFERIRDRIAAAETNAQNSKVETTEQKRAEAWRRIEQLNSEIRDDLYDLRTPEERARAKELEEELERRKKEEERILADPNATDAQKRAAMQARIDAQQAIDANDNRDVKRIEEDPSTTPADRDKLDQVIKPKIDARRSMYEATHRGISMDELRANEAIDVKPPEKYEKAAKSNLMDSLSEQPAPTAAVSSPELSGRTDVVIAANATTETGKTQSIPAIAQALNNSGVVSQTTQAPTVEATQPEVQLANLTVTKPAPGKSAGMFGA